MKCFRKNIITYLIGWKKLDKKILVCIVKFLNLMILHKLNLLENYISKKSNEKITENFKQKILDL